MFDQSTEIENQTHSEADVPAWLRLHRDMKSETRAQASWDARRARHLREAEAHQLWSHFGYVSILEYLEREHSIDPRTASDRLRVSHALAELPMLEAELEEGALQYSHVRELTRVVTPETEDEWIAAAKGKTCGEVQGMVAGHKKGDGPDDPSDPDLRKRRLSLEVSPQTLAMYRELSAAIETEMGHRLAEEDVFRIILERARDGAEGASTPAQVSICSHCERGWQNGAGFKAELDPAALETALCDADHMGSLDGEPERTRHTVSPRLRKQIIARDEHRCAMPGCRSARNLDVHHIVHQKDGGPNKPWNLVTLCSGHHRAHHEGLLAIEGSAPKALQFAWTQTFEDEANAKPVRAHRGTNDSHGGVQRAVNRDADAPRDRARPTRFELVALRTQARDALVGLGWKVGIATNAVDEAIGTFDHTAGIDVLIREALRRCPRPIG